METQEKLTNKKEAKKKYNYRDYATVAVIAVLLVFSVIQGVQINKLKEEFAEAGTTQASGAATATGTTSAPSTAPRPTMVGGC